MSMRKELEAIVLRATLGGFAWDLATGPVLTIGLHQGNPGEYGLPTTEVSGHGYTRMPIVFTLTLNNSNSYATNSTQIDFPVATSDYGAAITHFMIYADDTPIYVGECIPSQIITDTQNFTVKVGTLTIALD